jgi:hypothetical protein
MNLKLGSLYAYPYPVRIYNQITPISDFSIAEEHTPFVMLEVNETHCVTWLKVLTPTGLVGYVQYAKHLKDLKNEYQPKVY